MIQNAQSPGFMTKTDIADAFRIKHLHPSQYHLTGFQRDGYYYDKCLPMGCSSSCKIFEEFSTALQWILKTKYAITKVLDDFLFVTNTKVECQKYLQHFIHLSSDLLASLAPHKTVWPTNNITYLGIKIDSLAMKASLPVEKNNAVH